MSDRKRGQLRELAALEEVPAKQAPYAAGLLTAGNGLEVVKAALSVLVRHPEPSARNALRQLYWHYAENDGKRDPAAYTRSAILHALQPIMGMEDIELVVHAVTTYQFLPPQFLEEAALLRSTAIVMLSELDDQLAAYFATRMLDDGYMEPMSGEPALSAVRVLAAQGELLPLYAYVTQHEQGGRPEVMSEGLRNLGGAPEEVVRELVVQFGESEDPAVLVGLFDMLVLGPNAPRHPEYLAAFLQRTQDTDLYRYLVTLMLTSPSADVRIALVGAVQDEEGFEKIQILREGLAVASGGSEIEPLIQNFA